MGSPPDDTAVTAQVISSVTDSVVINTLLAQAILQVSRFPSFKTLLLF